MRETVAISSREGMKLQPERREPFPRRGDVPPEPHSLIGWQAKKGGKSVWDAEELDGGQARRWGAGIACQTLGERQPIVGPLGPRKDRRHGLDLRLWGTLDFHPLAVQELYTGASMLSAAPITPEEGRARNFERVKQHTHLARFGSGLAIPLTLLAQRAGRQLRMLAA